MVRYKWVKSLERTQKKIFLHNSPSNCTRSSFTTTCQSINLRKLFRHCSPLFLLFLLLRLTLRELLLKAVVQKIILCLEEKAVPFIYFPSLYNFHDYNSYSNENFMKFGRIIKMIWMFKSLNICDITGT